ncbi:hypothetical protein M9H77_34696 [Catharanthus roseus]|uniref:Uncharacterized protein n=1 Tax=Catharanthus roseus TaxID=4058 RepID=A0ACB9ZN48_CATRO|nr:hypothetical protein M9H77_34696 [Catharanthus roseus]
MADAPSSESSISVYSLSSSSTDSSSPGSSFDEFMDMRLDIDGMSYEEILGLQDRIGHVCTGVPESMMSECLNAKKCSTEDQVEGKSCSICLGVYTTKDEIATIKKCGHEFHPPCIKEWLLQKSVCPICKCTELIDPPKNQ